MVYLFLSILGISSGVLSALMDFGTDELRNRMYNSHVHTHTHTHTHTNERTPLLCVRRVTDLVHAVHIYISASVPWWPLSYLVWILYTILLAVIAMVITKYIDEAAAGMWLCSRRRCLDYTVLTRHPQARAFRK